MGSNWSLYSGILCVGFAFGLLALSVFLAIKDIEDETNLPMDPVVRELRRQWWINQVINNANRQADLTRHEHTYRNDTRND